MPQSKSESLNLSLKESHKHYFFDPVFICTQPLYQDETKKKNQSSELITQLIAIHPCTRAAQCWKPNPVPRNKSNSMLHSPP